MGEGPGDVDGKTVVRRQGERRKALPFVHDVTKVLILRRPKRRCGPGRCPYGTHTISRGCLATAKRLSQTVIAGLVPAIHAYNWLLTSDRKSTRLNSSH